MGTLAKEFSHFIDTHCDRRAFIQSYLEKNDIASVVLPIEGKNHIYVTFPNIQYNPQYKIKTVIAHYDRIQGSPGANDNSAAVFALLEWATRLHKKNDFHNVRLLFSDGEELGKNGVTEQGAFSLALIFKRLGLTNDDVYVFDAVGRGTVPVLGKTNLPINAHHIFRKNFLALEERAQKLLRASGNGHWLTLPLPYSDNAGFIACGIPAVVITMLPEDEASKYHAALIKHRLLESFIINGRLKGGIENDETVRKLKTLMPETWQLFHTANDTEESLTKESFTLMSQILDVLASEKTSA
ncbi:MAG: M28 family peptidase [Treponema sp.]|nr:M28 family peptidase [Treponema sp.]